MRLLLSVLPMTIGLMASGGFGNTAVPKRYHPLKKVTVGPYDSYQSSAVGSLIFFTKNLRPATGIYVKFAGGNESWPVLSNLASSRDPSPSPDGRFLAFTWFKHDAKGNVCIKPIPAHFSDKPDDQHVRCFSGSDSQDHSPFWISPTELGFVSRDFGDKSYSLIRQNIETNDQTVLISGLSSAPVLSPDGDLLAYSQWNAKNRSSSLVFRSLKDQRMIRDVQLLIPGVSGHGAFSPDQQYFYFGHYLNAPDDKKLLDIQEKSTIFRLNVDEVLKDGQVCPEQLTSSEFNCHFPNEFNHSLYLTCAFEGSLDIYSLEPEGQIPADWTVAHLEGAYQASRTYDERLFLLNKLKHRTKVVKHSEFNMRAFANHLHNSETTAALFELSLMSNQNSGGLISVEEKRLLEIWLQAQQLREKEPLGRVTEEFREKILKSILLAQGVNHPGSLKIIIKGLLNQLVGNDPAQHALSRSVRLTKNTSPLEWYLAHRWLERFWESETQKLLNFKLSTLTHRAFGAEFRLKFAFDFLLWADKNLSEPEMEALIKKIKMKLPSDDEVSILFESEALVRTLMASPDKESATKAFAPLNTIFQNTSHRYHLRKSVYIRAIQKLSKGNQQDFMDFIASHWLRYTDTDQMEFSYAADQYLWSALDHAYRVWHRNENSRASSSFYNVLSQLDDYEAHLGYLNVNNQISGSEGKVLETYEYLESLNKIASENRYFRSAYRVLRQSKLSEKDLRQVIDDLSRIELRSGVSPEIICLLQGYAWHRLYAQSLLSRNPDTSKLQAAHRYYDMALDLSHDNDRVRSAVLSNLGLLHGQGKNYGVSAGYLKKRLQYPFVTRKGNLATKILYSRVLFHSYRTKEAIEILLPLMEGIRSSDEVKLIADRLGFYNIVLGDYQKAASYYQTFFKHVYGSPSARYDRQYLSLGYAYFKSGQYELAHKNLTMFLKLSPNNHYEADRISGIHHGKRRHLITYGLMAQLPLSPARQLIYKRKRIDLLLEAKSQPMILGLNKTVWLATLAKDYQQISEILFSQNDPKGAWKAMEESLEFALKWSEAAQGSGPVIYKTIVNALSLALLDRSLTQKPEKIENAVLRLQRNLEKEASMIQVRREQLRKLNRLKIAFDQKFSSVSNT